MQIQKDEIREKIIEVAEKEFLKKGFKSASMRTMAKKANTTLGNMYNYFENKEAILDAVIGEVPGQIDAMLVKHGERNIEVMDRDEMNKQMAQFLPGEFGFDQLLSKPFVILMEGCKETKYEHYREEFFELISEHLKEHLGEAANPLLVKTIGHSFMAALLFIAKNKSSLEEGKKDLTRYIQMMIIGIMGETKGH